MTRRPRPSANTRHSCLPILAGLLSGLLTLLPPALASSQDGFPGHALLLRGIDSQRIECGSGGSLGLVDQLTVEAWVKLQLPDGSYEHVILGNHPGFLFEILDDGILRFWWNGGELDVYGTGTDLRGYAWHHVAITRDGSEDEIILYADGVRIGVFPAGSDRDVIWPLGFGNDFRPPPSAPFHGYLDEVRLWNVARTREELRENMHLTLTGSEPGLLAYWQLNEGDGSTVIIDSVGGHDGTLVGMSGDEWVTSEAPVGAGTSISRIVSGTGEYDFMGTSLRMDFTAKTGTDTFVAARLDLAPAWPNIPDCQPLDSQYWIVNHFGAGSYTADLTFTVNEDLGPAEEADPSLLRLFGRPSGLVYGTSYWAWDPFAIGSHALAADNTATFPGATVLGQLLVGRELFTDIGAGLIGVTSSAAAWGDYDGDGDLDAVISGWLDWMEGYSRIYRNDDGTFTDIDAGLVDVYISAAAWGDYDNDGDLDLALCGYVDSLPVSRLYRNDEGEFVTVEAGLPDVGNGSLAWGDCDNDGDLDLALSGDTGAGLVSRIYRNQDGALLDIGAGLPGVRDGSTDWGDHDGDGDLDLLMTGYSDAGYVASVFRNDAGVFTDIDAGLPGAYDGSCAWGDYDNDGDLDIVLNGHSGLGVNTFVYRNDGGVFVDIEADLTNSSGGSASWGDYDNDGDLDLLMTEGQQTFIVYRNDAGVFVDIEAGMIDYTCYASTWGDHDNDGDLDILMTGATYTGRIARIYRNNVWTANTPPEAPTDLAAVYGGGRLTLSWNPAVDAQTPTSGLTYNLRVGTSPSGHEILSAHALDSGRRTVPAPGNANHGTSWSLAVPHGVYYWSVQAVDAAFAGSPFATEEVVDTTTDVTPAIPTRFALHAPTPNPFNPRTAIHFDLPEPARIVLRIYDLSGRRVRTLHDGERLPRGHHQAVWDGRNGERRMMAAGAYICRLEAGGNTAMRRMTLLK